MQKIFLVKVKTNSSSKKVDIFGDLIKVEVKSKPENNKANDELVEILAKYFNLKKSEVKILSGKSSKTKKILIKTPNTQDN